MPIVILVSGNKFSQELLKDLFLIHFYSIYILITFSFLSARHYDSSFSEPLEMSNESTIHIENIKVLTTEIIKFLNDFSNPNNE